MPKKKTTSPDSSNMKSIWVTLTVLVILLILMLLGFAYIYSESSRDKQKLVLASDLSLMTQEIMNIGLNQNKSDSSDFAQLDRLRNTFHQKHKALLNTERNSYFGLARDDFSKINEQWGKVTENLNVILNARNAVVLSHKYTGNVHDILPELQESTEDVVLKLSEFREGEAKQRVGINLIVLLQKLQNSLLIMLEGEKDTSAVTHGFVDNFERYSEQVKLLLSGDHKRNLSPVRQPETREQLKSMFTRVNSLGEHLGALLDYSGDLKASRQHTHKLINHGNSLFNETRKLEYHITNRDQRLRYISLVTGILALLSLLSLIWLMYTLYKDRQRQLELTTEDNEKHQYAIMSLLEKMTALSEGDLTVSARVTEDITGALSDAFNYTVEALRILVTKINDTSGRLNEFARKADRTSAILSDASHAQSEEIVSASSVIVTFSESVERIAKYANNAARAADHSLKISKQGVHAVNETIDGMRAIREQVQATAKRIKRLSESSQEISQVSQLMNEIAEQTQMLALNASIQMSSAGDAGKGFGNVADEVQQLAKRALATSSKVNVLVKTIQADTNETVASMEETISHVVSGTSSAEKSGQALGQIDKESSRLAALMMNIANITNDQSEMANDVTKRMVSIQDITLQAFERANETTDLINSLTTTANELQESVYRFTLPDRSSRR